MRRHPPKVSRKKLRAEIERLKGQVAGLNIAVQVIGSTARCLEQIVAASASAAARKRVWEELYSIRNEPDKINVMIMHEHATSSGGVVRLRGAPC